MEVQLGTSSQRRSGSLPFRLIQYTLEHSFRLIVHLEKASRDTLALHDWAKFLILIICQEVGPIE